MRGQAHTLEAFVAGLLVLSGITFALQATAVTPLSASTSNQHIGNQEQAAADGLLAAADEDESLESTVLNWNASGDGQFVGTGSRSYHTEGGPPDAFGQALNETFGDERTAFNVRVYYRDVNDTRVSRRLVYMGSPTDDATATGRTVVLYNDTELTAPGATRNVSEARANASTSFYAPDVDRDGRLFNVVEVRIVVWRI